MPRGASLSDPCRNSSMARKAEKFCHQVRQKLKSILAILVNFHRDEIFCKNLRCLAIFVTMNEINWN